MKTLALVLSIMLFGGSAFAQSSTAPARKKKSTVRSTASGTTEMQAFRDALAAEQQQINELKQQLQQRDQTIQQIQQQLAQTQATASEAQTKADAATESAKVVPVLQSDVSDLKTNLNSTVQTIQDDQKREGDLENPLAIHYKGITITPGGYLAAETVWRNRGLASDINTPFNTVPFTGSAQHNLSEFFGSARQSRLSLLAEGKLGAAKMTGYYETDFLSAGVTSNNNQSNSYTLRQRQVWGQASFSSGWSFTGGQMWSLVTETRNGVDNRTEAPPMVIDAQYNIGFSWARQYGARVAKNFHNRIWLAMSVENPQTTFTAHGNANNFLIGAPGTGGGLYNLNANYAFNVAPDLIFKGAFQPGPGLGHYEVFGLVRHFRDRVFPNATASTPSSAGAFNDTRTGGGIGANARGSIFNNRIALGLHFLGGNGVGRYGTGGLPDATIRPDGTLLLLRNYQALGTLEWHSKKWDIYSNAGVEYEGRGWRLNAAGKPVGYGSPLFVNNGCLIEALPGAGGFAPGSPANCTGDTRSLIEGTFGFWYKLYVGKVGTVQWGPQYSYVVRNTWSGTAGSGALGQPHGIDNMFFTSFRYVLP